jgi:hypothetical protein
MTIETFPQQPGKPTVEELLASDMTQLSGAELLALWQRHYPELSAEDVQRLYAESLERLKREADRDERFLDFVRTAYRDATGSDLPDDMPMGEVLQVIAQRGSPLARARVKAQRAYLDSPESRAFYRDFAAAVALDPYWIKLPEAGHYRVRPGARHKTGEALVAAYRAAYPLKGRIAADFAKLMHGVDPADEDAGDKTHAAMRQLWRRYPEATTDDFDDEALVRAWLEAAR